MTGLFIDISDYIPDPEVEAVEDAILADYILIPSSANKPTY